MELKLVGVETDGVLPRFNRTFMELKYGICNAGIYVKGRFNRTFMELKFLTNIADVDLVWV